MNKGLSKSEHISLLKQFGMTTKKWSKSKLKQYEKARLELTHQKSQKRKKGKNK